MSPKSAVYLNCMATRTELRISEMSLSLFSVCRRTVRIGIPFATKMFGISCFIPPYPKASMIWPLRQTEEHCSAQF